MVINQRMDNATYECNAVDLAFLRMELHDGVLVEKPVMSRIHGDFGMELAFLIRTQIDPTRYRLRANHAKLAVPGRSYFIPDVAVLPADLARGEPTAADLYHEPIPLVVEVWSPSTGEYDAAIKLPGYRDRGDAEIWWVYLPEQSLTRWLRRPDGGYDEETITGGTFASVALPMVRIDLDALFQL